MKTMGAVFGERVRALRELRNLKQDSLAAEAELQTPGAISKIESGLSEPNVSRIYALARALDVPIGALFEEQEYERACRILLLPPLEKFPIEIVQLLAQFLEAIAPHLHPACSGHGSQDSKG